MHWAERTSDLECHMSFRVVDRFGQEQLFVLTVASHFVFKGCDGNMDRRFPKQTRKSVLIRDVCLYLVASYGSESRDAASYVCRRVGVTHSGITFEGITCLNLVASDGS